MAVANHQASYQMLGYLYQVRCALDLLLAEANEQTCVCIEKFDDIAFSNEGTSPATLIQTKHHIKGSGDLSDRSVDLWRTIKVWIDYTSKNNVESTKFIIVTTATAPSNSAASFLRPTLRDEKRAYSLLNQVTSEISNQTNRPYYMAFSELSTDIAQTLLSNVFVIDNNHNVVDIVESIKRNIRYSTRPEYEQYVFESIEGWWFSKMIDALSSDNPIFISQREVRSKIRDIADTYLQNNLPINVDKTEEANIENISTENRLFCEQLRWIALGDRRKKMAVSDYYRAYTQRNKWIQDDLIYIDELEDYDYRLVDVWSHLFAVMEDDLHGINDESEKRKAGCTLYTKIETDTDVRIRPLCSDAFVMRGSYHILANSSRVGWHVDFEQFLAAFSESGGVL